MPLPTISTRSPRRTLHHDVLLHLTERILDGTLEPGERLNDSELSAWLGVSRTPIREALMILAARGLVETQPNRYTRVTQINLEEFTERQLVIARLAELAVVSAIEASDDATLATLAAEASKAAGVFAGGDDRSGSAALCDSIELYAQASKNVVLESKLLEQLPAARRAYRSIWSELPLIEMKSAWESLAKSTTSRDQCAAAHTIRRIVSPIMLTTMTRSSAS